MSTWPTISDYEESILVPQLRDSHLRAYTVLKYSASQAKDAGFPLLEGTPIRDKGNIAIAFRISNSTANTRHILRVFTNPASSVNDLRKRYLEIETFRKRTPDLGLVEVKWFDKAILVTGQWKPAILMDLVEGEELELWLRKNRQDKTKLLAMADQFEKLVAKMEANKMSHGDLSHRNIMVTSSGELKLIDYDSIYLPSLQSEKPGEAGLPGFQHPKRKPTDYGPTWDRFSHLVIYATLLRIAESPNSLPRVCDDGLILQGNHFVNSTGSPLEAMARSQNNKLKKIARAIIDSSQKSLSQVPSLSEVLNASLIKPVAVNSSSKSQQLPEYLNDIATGELDQMFEPVKLSNSSTTIQPQHSTQTPSYLKELALETQVDTPLHSQVSTSSDGQPSSVSETSSSSVTLGSIISTLFWISIYIFGGYSLAKQFNIGGFFPKDIPSDSATINPTPLPEPTPVKDAEEKLPTIKVSPPVADRNTLYNIGPLCSVLIPDSWKLSNQSNKATVGVSAIFLKNQNSDLVIRFENHESYLLAPSAGDMSYLWNAFSVMETNKRKERTLDYKYISSNSTEFNGRPALTWNYEERSPTTGRQRRLTKVAIYPLATPSKPLFVTIIRPADQSVRFADEIQNILNTLVWKP